MTHKAKHKQIRTYIEKLSNGRKQIKKLQNKQSSFYFIFAIM